MEGRAADSVLAVLVADGRVLRNIPLHLVAWTGRFPEFEFWSAEESSSGGVFSGRLDKHRRQNLNRVGYPFQHVQKGVVVGCCASLRFYPGSGRCIPEHPGTK